MVDEIWIAWDSGVDMNVGAAFDVNKLKHVINQMEYRWIGEWVFDEDGTWERDYKGYDENEVILLEYTRFIE